MFEDFEGLAKYDKKENRYRIFYPGIEEYIPCELKKWSSNMYAASEIKKTITSPKYEKTMGRIFDFVDANNVEKLVLCKIYQRLNIIIEQKIVWLSRDIAKIKELIDIFNSSSISKTPRILSKSLKDVNFMKKLYKEVEGVNYNKKEEIVIK